MIVSTLSLEDTDHLSTQEAGAEGSHPYDTNPYEGNYEGNYEGVFTEGESEALDWSMMNDLVSTSPPMTVTIMLL